jgi:chromosome segregation ATPase
MAVVSMEACRRFFWMKRMSLPASAWWVAEVWRTRLRTREAAVCLVAAGRRPHDLTVDLIYAEIRQGSRTTINDELKLWKDEQAKADALTDALPPAVANAMLNIWAIAVEHGEKVFDQRRDEVEGQWSQAMTQIEGLEVEKNRFAQRVESLQEDLNHSQSEIDELQGLLAIERTAKDAAIAQAGAVERQLELARTDAEQAVATLKSEHRQQVDQMQAAFAAQESAFRQEIDKTTERLEGVQKHVMLQVAEAREAQKRAETQLSKAAQKAEQLSTEAQELRKHIALSAQMSERAKVDLTAAHEEMSKLRAERESLIQQVAAGTGKLDALVAQIESLERRAVGAEGRLEEALTRSATTAKKKPESLTSRA